jgi:hypothetical protein
MRWQGYDLLGHLLLQTLAPSGNQIASNHAKIFGGCFNMIAWLGTLLQGLKKSTDLRLVVEMRAGSTVAQVSNAAKTTVFDTSNLESTPAHRVAFFAS